MVLHNDKWTRKAKRANERRKGVSTGTGRGRGGGTPGQTLERLDMGRPDPEEQEDETDSSGDSSHDNSFEFDSGDEGKTEQEKMAVVAMRSSANKVEPATSISLLLDKRQASETSAASGKTKELAASEQHPTGANAFSQSIEPPRVDKKFARRKLIDNSSRYEEAALDPYLKPEETEPEPDYKSMVTKQFSNPREVELVPDTRTTRKTPLPMTTDEKVHFEQLRQMQQKEEYAREMKSRFGQRKGFNNDNNAQNLMTSQNEDDFFAEITKSHGDEGERAETARMKSDCADQGAASAEHEQLERYLDDLLKL